VLLTRAAQDAADWAEALAADGAEVKLLPCIRTEAITGPALAARLRAALKQADWLVFTSRRGVDALADLLAEPLPAGLKIATVGQATAARVRERFGRHEAAAGDDIRVGSGTGATLGRELAAEPGIRAGAGCVLALAENAGDALERALIGAGAFVERFDVYRTLPAAALEPKLRLSAMACDTVVLASASAVTGFDNQVNVDLAAQIVTIGPSTSAAVRELGWPVAAEAREPSLAGIIDCLLEKPCA
jgi:uroporphyrinogen-III synthase